MATADDHCVEHGGIRAGSFIARQGVSVIRVVNAYRFRVESLIAMGLFTADIFRNLVIGFGLGALAIAISLATQILLALL